MLEKQITIDKIEVLENGVVQVRQAITIKEDGVDLSKSYHRWALSPGQDVSSQPANVQAICAAAWTPEVIAAYAAQQEASKP